VIQFCIMFSGLAATVWIALNSVPGGLGEIWSAAASAGKTTLSMPLAVPAGAGIIERVRLFFEQPINVTAILCAIVFGRMAGYTSDQVMVQRFQTTKSLADSKRAFVINAAGDALWMFGLSFVGLALLAYFKVHAAPTDLPPDKVLPYFMAQAFPAGAVGLVIAAILAASLSSIDSAINSCTSVVVIDLYNRLGARRSDDSRSDDRRQVFVSRVSTVAFGAAGTLLATNVARIGTLLEIANKLVNAFSGPLFGIYVLAMFSRRATATPVLLGGVAGTLVSYLVAYRSSIGFMWPSTFGLAATIVVGWTLSVAARTQPTDAALRFTWTAVMERRDTSTGPDTCAASAVN